MKLYEVNSIGGKNYTIRNRDMLIQLHINHLVTIQSLHLDFKAGTTIFTGESGAGKSILIDAIELALGKRATYDIIRADQEKAEIGLCFDVSHLKDARKWLEQYDLDQNSECIIRRTIHRDGRSRSFINGVPTTLPPLRELGELLLQIHGQHEHQFLLKNDTQRALLDRYAGHHALLEQVRTLAEEWQQLSKERTHLQRLIEDRNNRDEFLKFQLQELNELNLSAETFQQLDLEHKQLAHAEALLHNIQNALSYLSEQEVNSSSLLNQAMQSLEHVQRFDPKVTSWLETLKHALVCINDTENELRHHLDKITWDPKRLQWLNERIQLMFDIARKHKISPGDLYNFKLKLHQDYAELAQYDDTLAALTEKIILLEKEYGEAAHTLSQSRKHAAIHLQTEITKLLHQLSLPEADFQIIFEKEASDKISPQGLEKVIYYIKTNVGHVLQPLAKIASGGELSRMCLAIHLATADQNHTPTLIFDEIDVGVGGKATEMIGKLLRRLGKSHQVFCITHQPQVAAYSHQHIRVEKINKENVAHTLIQELTPEEKIMELARMLGGIKITQKTLAHARELVEKSN